MIPGEGFKWDPLPHEEGAARDDPIGFAIARLNQARYHDPFVRYVYDLGRHGCWKVGRVTELHLDRDQLVLLAYNAMRSRSEIAERLIEEMVSRPQKAYVLRPGPDGAELEELRACQRMLDEQPVPSEGRVYADLQMNAVLRGPRFADGLGRMIVEESPPPDQRMSLKAQFWVAVLFVALAGGALWRALT